MIIDRNLEWTNHSLFKMRFYRLSKSQIKKILKFPERVEEGIVPQTIALMRRSSSKKRQELWVMCQTKKIKGRKITRIISAWRYPGQSPKRNPIPKEILEEVQRIIRQEA